MVNGASFGPLSRTIIPWMLPMPLNQSWPMPTAMRMPMRMEKGMKRAMRAPIPTPICPVSHTATEIRPP